MKTLFTYVLFLAPTFLSAQDYREVTSSKKANKVMKVNAGWSANHYNLNAVFDSIARDNEHLFLTADFEKWKKHDLEESQAFTVGGIGIAYGTEFGSREKLRGFFRAGAGLAFCHEESGGNLVESSDRIADKLTTTYSAGLDLEYRLLFLETELLAGGLEQNENEEDHSFADLVCRMGLEFIPRFQLVGGFHSFLQEYTAEVGYDLNLFHGRSWLLFGYIYDPAEVAEEPLELLSVRISCQPWGGE